MCRSFRRPRTGYRGGPTDPAAVGRSAVALRHGSLLADLDGTARRRRGPFREDFAQPSGCRGWLVRDLVCHLVIDAQDVLITLATPAEKEPTRDAATYWEIVEPRPATTRSTR